MKGLYGLKQARRAWYFELAGTLTGMGFKRSSTDHSLFYHPTQQTLLAVSTDDILIVAKTQRAVEEFKKSVATHYSITDLGEARWLLGFEIKRNRQQKTVYINQNVYIQEVTKRFRLLDAKPIYTPIEVGSALAESSDAVDVPYQEGRGHMS